MLETMGPLVTCSQGKLTEAYFQTKKVEEVIDVFEKTCKKAHAQFQSMYATVVSLTKKLGNEEK